MTKLGVKVLHSGGLSAGRGAWGDRVSGAPYIEQIVITWPCCQLVLPSRDNPVATQRHGSVARRARHKASIARCRPVGR
jgi:hypothetical protein